MSKSNKIFKRQPYRNQNVPCNLATILHHLENGDLDLDAYYQRDYVWTQKEQKEFLDAVMSSKPLGTISVTIRDPSKDTEYIEVVDGKQRITTLKLFFESKIKYNGFLWRDLDWTEKNEIKNVKIGWNELIPTVDTDGLSEKIILEFFHDINFVGIPQSKEHHHHVLELIRKSQDKK